VQGREESVFVNPKASELILKDHGFKNADEVRSLYDAPPESTQFKKRSSKADKDSQGSYNAPDVMLA
jgi:hypothetical protein